MPAKQSNLIIFLFMLLFSACMPEKQPINHEPMKEKIELADLIGKTYEWVYPSLTYHITIKSDTTLYWKLIKGEFPGISESDEQFIHTQLYPQVHFISWTEASGLGLYNVLDFNTNRLTTHGNHDGKMFEHTGTFRLVE